MSEVKMVEAVSSLAAKIYELVMTEARETGLPCAAVVGVLDMAKDQVKEDFEKA